VTFVGPDLKSLTGPSLFIRFLIFGYRRCVPLLWRGRWTSLHLSLIVSASLSLNDEPSAWWLQRPFWEIDPSPLLLFVFFFSRVALFFFFLLHVELFLSFVRPWVRISFLLGGVRPLPAQVRRFLFRRCQ